MAVTGTVQAALVSFDMSVIYSGTGVPMNPPPWLNATFVDVSPSHVDLTISAVGLTGGEKVEGVYFNLAPALNPAQLAFSAPTKTGAFANPTISHGSISKPYDQYKADGDGKYDILIAFNTDGLTNAFNGGEAVKYTITLASLTANSFDFISAPGGGAGEYKTAAHLQALQGLQALGCPTGDSAWVTTPEPATMALLGLGALSLLQRKRSV